MTSPRNNKPTQEELASFAAGEVAGSRAAQIEAWLKTAPASAAAVTRMRAAVMTMRGDDTVAPSQSAIQRAKSVFVRQVSQAAPSWLERLERLVATLVFDSRAQLAPAGYRGDEDGFQISYESPAAAIDVQVERVAPVSGADPLDRMGPWRLMGQITPARESEQTLHVALVPAGTMQPTVEAGADSHGVFTLDAPAGEFDLLVKVGSSLVVLPRIRIA